MSHIEHWFFFISNFCVSVASLCVSVGNMRANRQAAHETGRIVQLEEEHVKVAKERKC